MSDFMNASQAAQRLGVSVARVYQLVREGRLPHIRRGRRLLIPSAAWEMWLAQQVATALESAEKTRVARAGELPVVALGGAGTRAADERP